MWGTDETSFELNVYTMVDLLLSVVSAVRLGTNRSNYVTSLNALSEEHNAPIRFEYEENLMMSNALQVKHDLSERCQQKKKKNNIGYPFGAELFSHNCWIASQFVKTYFKAH